MNHLMATIPQIMMWDDHDIFNGWGTYPESILTAPHSQAIYNAARRFYLLFQHHTTSTRLQQGSDYPDYLTTEFGGLSFLKTITPHLTLLAVDLRSERTMDQVVSWSMWKKVTTALTERVPSTCHHLMILSSIPVVWPAAFLAEAALNTVGKFVDWLDLGELFQESPLGRIVKDFFGNDFSVSSNLKMKNLLILWFNRGW